MKAVVLKPKGVDFNVYEDSFEAKLPGTHKIINGLSDRGMLETVEFEPTQWLTVFRELKKRLSAEASRP
ncbi:MAG: hypothetical protein KKD39_03080 [Candidatus Altiarchaeota archaeon]|nr:hypothetical protein [Candidatus Altiarchaeota archaeon]